MKKLVLLAGLIAFVMALVLQVSGIAVAKPMTPKEGYDAYHKAILTGDFNLVSKCVTKEALKELKSKAKTKADIAKLMQMLKAFAPTEYKITKITYKDGKKTIAHLYIKGKMKDMMSGKLAPAFGMATMHKEGNSWKLHKENWSDKPVK